MRNYILDGTEPQLEPDLMTWARWIETADRHVEDNTIGGVRVSTVFLGTDHGYLGNGPPVLFETMVFGGKHDQAQERYSTWDEAVAGHERMVAMVSNDA